MNILALDTSTEFLSLALQVNGQMYSHYSHAGQTASQLILPQIHTLLEAADAKLTDLDGIAFGAGPGSFTGVRIACGVAQGLGFGVNLPVVGINTLHALAQASGTDKVISCLDARMGEVYHAAMLRQGAEWIEVTATGVYKPNEVPAVSGEGWVAAGSGWQAYDAVLSQRYQVTEKMLALTPTAEAVLQLAAPIFEAKQARPASEARPIYIRNRVALTSDERAQGARL